MERAQANQDVHFVKEKATGKDKFNVHLSQIHAIVEARRVYLTFDEVLFTPKFDGRGGVDSIHPLFTCENNSKSNFINFCCMVKYSQFS